MAEKKYYWLKLQKDFFKRHDIKIIENMPNGKDYILFYLKLLVESVSHNGELRFSETIPYNEDMLATITDTNIDIVRSAMKIFSELQMIEILDDSTIYMIEVERMIGAETDEHTREQNRIRQQRYRENQKALHNVTVTLHRNAELDIEKELDIDKEKNIDIYNRAKSTRFVPPTLEEVQNYCRERNNNVNPETFIDFYESKGWMVGKNKMKDWKSAVRTWERNGYKNNNSKPVAPKIGVDKDEWLKMWEGV